MTDSRAQHEIEHGRRLASADTEQWWGWGTPAGRRRAERRGALIAEGGRLGPGTVALELGCGTGLFTEAFAQRGGRVVAVDISPELLERARARGLPPERVEFVAADFHQFGDGCAFDAIVGSSVLHHLDVAAALARAFRLLRPGGRLSFAEPNMLNPQIFLERHARWLFPQVSPDETAFVRGPLRRLLERSGFREVSIRPFDWLHPAVPARLISSVERLGRILEHTPFVREFAGSLWIVAQKPEGRP
jgi:SAM-dependent methyltransferase